MSDQTPLPPDEEELRADDLPEAETAAVEPQTDDDVTVIDDAVVAVEPAREDDEAAVLPADEGDASDAPRSDAPADDVDVDDADYDDQYDDDAYDEAYTDDDEALTAVGTSEATFDWGALASAGDSAGHAEVPDLTAGGASAMEVDIDAALAAVDTLGAVVAAEQERKREEADRREAQHRADEEYRRWAESYVFRRPGMIRVQGGRVVTILPAVALMAIGAVLTLATASGQAMPWQTLFSAASAGISISLLSYWLASGRWGRGALFAALAVASAGVWVFAASLPDVELTWRLPVIALGAALAVTGFIGRPRSLVWTVTGLGIAIGAAALPYLSQPTLQRFGPLILAAAAVLIFLPAVFRTRRG